MTHDRPAAGLRRAERSQLRRKRDALRALTAGAEACVTVTLLDGLVLARTGGPIDDPGDLELPHWAGVIPVEVVRGEPQQDVR